MGNRPRSRVRKLLLFGLLPLLVLLVFTLVVVAVAGHRAAGRAEARALAAWEEGVGPMGGPFAEEFPGRETNEEALELERLAGALGIELAPKPSGRDNVPEEAPDAWRPASGYLSGVVEAREDVPAEAPAEVREFCSEQGGDLDALLRHLQDSDPRWMLHLEKGPAAPIPNLLGQIRLQKLLLACALEWDGQGEGDAAARALEASWRLNERLGRRPELISALIHLAVARLQAGTLRHLRSPEPAWQERFEAADPVAALSRSARGEGQMMYLISQDLSTFAADVSGGPSVWERFLEGNPVVRPWLRHAMFVMLEASGRFHARAAEMPPCDFDYAPLTDRLTEETRTLNPLSRIAELILPNLGEAWARARRLEVDQEAAARILAFKIALAGERRPPRNTAELEALVEARGLETGSICPGGRWVYELDEEDAAYVVRYEGPEVRSDFQGAVSPLEQRIPVGRR